MSKLHPAMINHIQAMQDDLADMMDNPDDTLCRAGRAFDAVA
jgi:hypothetical protein